MKKRSPIKKILILVTVLAVPGFLYYLLTEKGKNRYRPLDIFGPKQVAATFHTKRGVKIPDTIYHHVRDFKLVDQNGDSVGLPADTTQITVVNFFFSRCRTVCPQMNNELARVVDAYKKNPLVKFYSISVDPGYDSPQVLKNYANGYKAAAEKWSFLTGEKDLIFNLAKKDFLVDAVADSRTEGNIVHSPLFILLDPKKRIRGYYDSTNKEQVDKLIDEIKVQIVEELRLVTAI
ncbi:SCO family protein [Desertivirga xinjiangensis]|uniref:SCO family protein n=1 Tax=Desertivirga xinjiangensis TaxID=539206 RepID=UPI00210A1E35|nr:SCO family protein [Pedobacter xinjiangensis]